MKTRALTILLCTVTLACGAGPQVSPQATGLKLTMPSDGFAAAKPAKISLFFSVDTNNGEPVAGLGPDSFQILEDGAPVSQYESRLSIRPKGQKFRMYSLLLLDLSGSVMRSGDFPRLSEAASAFIDSVLAQELDSERLAIYAFDGRREIQRVVDFTNDAAALKAGLRGLEVAECRADADCALMPDRRTCAGWRCVDDSTNLFGAVVQGLERVAGQRELEPSIPHRQGALVLFTDGRDQAARVSAQDAQKAVAASPDHVFTVGLGGEIDAPTLERVGKDGFYSALRSEELRTAFDGVASRLNALAHRFYFIEYCSPKRSGTHQLEVRVSLATERGVALKGSLTSSFDATGFESGCSIE